VNGIIYFGAFDSNVVALNASDGSFLWRYPIAGALRATPTVVNGRIYSVNESKQSHIKVLNANNGTLIWERSLTSEGATTPPVAGRTVYIGLTNGSMLARNALDGHLLWTFQAGGTIYSSSPVVA
jgi:outer membrane protein assembly factor BamB